MSVAEGYYDESYPPWLWIPDPQIASLNPNTGSAAGGPITVTVTGSNFIRTSVVEVDNTEVPTTYVSSTQLTAEYDPPVAGTDVFTVRNGGFEGGEESNGMTFTVTALQEDETESDESDTYVAKPIDRDDMPPDVTEESP